MWTKRSGASPAGFGPVCLPPIPGPGARLTLALHHFLDHVDQLPPRAARLATQAVEGLLVADAVALHQDALRTLDSRPATERGQQLAVLPVALQSHVDAALQFGLCGGVE